MDTQTSRDDMLTRDAILKLLSDEEVARVSIKEASSNLAAGDEYLDLEHLDRGVRRTVAATAIAMGSVLPRSAVQAATWSKICSRLAPGR